MADFNNFNDNYNSQPFNIEPYRLVDAPTGDTQYIGVSSSFKVESAPIWQIKKIYKVGTVIYTGYPNGCQNFQFVWSDRCTYIYS